MFVVLTMPYLHLRPKIICKGISTNLATRKNNKIGCKTDAVTTVATPVWCKLAVDNEVVEQIMEVNYLGVTITSCGSVGKEISGRNIKLNKCQDVLWNNKILDLI